MLVPREGQKKQIQLIGHHLSNAKRQMPSAVPQLLAPFLSLLEALDAERPRGSTSHDLEAEISHPKTWINGGKKKQKVWHHFAEGFFLNKIRQVVVFLSFLKPIFFLLSIR